MTKKSPIPTQSSGSARPNALTVRTVAAAAATQTDATYNGTAVACGVCVCGAAGSAGGGCAPPPEDSGGRSGSALPLGGLCGASVADGIWNTDSTRALPHLLHGDEQRLITQLRGEPHSVPPVTFGVVHGHIRPMQQRVAIRVALPALREAEAHGHSDRCHAGLHLELGCLYGRAQGLDPRGRLLERGLRHEYGELLASKPGDQIVVAEVRFHEPGDAPRALRRRRGGRRCC